MTLSCISVVCFSTFGSRSPATEPQTPPQDFSAEAENAHGNPLEPLRDPGVRRWMLDRLDEKRFEPVTPITPINDVKATLTPSDGSQDLFGLPPEVRQIQESLGGPAVNQFPSLRWDAAASQRRQGGADVAIQQRLLAVRALREAATQLDTTANRLEQLELYRQADGLRQQAQRLRIDARGMTGADPDAQPPSPSTPAVWLDDRPAQPPAWNNGAPSPAREAPPTYSPPQPQLEPVPQPQDQADPPKPQPLMDSPETTPQPDVEVEG